MPLTALDSLQIKAFTAIAEHGGWEINGIRFANYGILEREYGLPDSREALIQYLIGE